MAADRPIVVGIDGSESSDSATRWAIAEARSRGPLPVRLVYALEPLGSERRRGVRYDVPRLREGAQNVVTDMLCAAEPLASQDVPLTGNVVDGRPPEVLTAESENAALLVLGSRHFGTGRSLLGSVSCATAAMATCPVVVVRGPGGEPDEVAPVVVGIDGTEHSEHVLSFAFEYAARQGLPVHATMCWNPHSLARQGRLEVPTEDELIRARTTLLERVVTWEQKYPDVQVHPDVVEGHPIEVLVARSARADLLVVGAKGTHAVAGTLLGSVSQGVLHHASCPVAVVH